RESVRTDDSRFRKRDTQADRQQEPDCQQAVAGRRSEAAPAGHFAGAKTARLGAEGRSRRGIATDDRPLRSETWRWALTMLEFVRSIILGQLEAALCMLHDCVRKCPQEHWEGKIANDTFRQVAYHTIFYVDVYLSPNEAAFTLRDLHL